MASRQIFFLTNLTAAILWVGMCVVAFVDSLINEGSPFAMIGGAILVWPALALGAAELILYIREMKKIERALGIFFFVVSAIALVAFITNAAEAMLIAGGADLQFWLVFGGVCFSVAAYGFWCGWIRCGVTASLRRRRGLCPACAYPVGKSPVCTECGAKLPAPSRR